MASLVGVVLHFHCQERVHEVGSGEAGISGLAGEEVWCSPAVGKLTEKPRGWCI